MPNQDQNLVYGWHAQKLGATAGQSGFAQHGQSPVESVQSVASALQVSAGAPSPVAGNVTQILANPGYATGNGTFLGVVTGPTLAASTVGFQNNTGLAAVVSITSGTVTAVAVAPNVPGTGAGTYATVAGGTGVQVTVPPAGWIKITYSVAPTLAWTTIN